MDKAGDGVSKKTKRTLEEILKNRKKAKKPKMVVAVSNEDDINDFFTWEEYLEKCRARAVPKSAFKHVPASDSKASGFKQGMKVEAKDSSSTSNSYWVATVVMVSGPLLLLRFDGYDNDRSGDFWLNSSSQLLQPIGWCAKTDNLLIPPEAIRHKEQNWAKYLINNLKNAIPAPDHLFHKSVEDDNKNLKIGAKLEVQDSENPLCYWVASVVEIFGLRLRLRFEGYESEDGDIWENLLSDRLHNLGWSKQMKMMLKPPEVMEKYSRWAVFRRVTEMCFTHSDSEHMKDKQEASLPVNKGFKPGMKVEAVNPENPLLICAATVRNILNKHFFTVEIDSAVGSAEMPPLQFLCHSRSKYIFPVGWCGKNNVKLTPPKGYTSNSFQWKSYLDTTNAEAVPEALFQKDLVKQKPISLSDLNQIKLGSFMEVLDEDDPTSFWVGKVVRSVGFKLYVNLQGDSNLDHAIEVYYLSESVHHLGWGLQAGLNLKLPKDLKFEWLDEKQLLNELYKLTIKADPNSQLKLKKEDSLPDIHGFKEGMQLEAVNPQDPSSICVASVKRIFNKYYFTVQIDSLINTGKDKNIMFWCHAQSRNIFPVGWCDKNKLQLTPPPGYSNKEFRWDTYMESMQTKAAPESLFYQDVPSTEFENALKLEAVDQTKPETISVATVSQVVGRTIWVRLDGYPSNAVEHIYDVESYNLLPVGWCGTYGHPLLTPHQKKKRTTDQTMGGIAKKTIH